MSCTAIAAQARGSGLDRARLEAHRRLEASARRADAARPQRRRSCDAIARMRAGGARNADIAHIADAIATPSRGRRGAAASGAPQTPRRPPAPFAASAPEEVAALRQGLLAGGLGKRELLGLVRPALALATVDLIDDRTLPPDRRAQGLARIAITIKTLPDDAPAAGAASHDHQSGPATFEETNVFLEELAQRLSAFGAGGPAIGVPGEPAAAGTTEAG